MLKYLLFCKCVILLASFEGIKCSFLERPVSHFSMADIFNYVSVEYENDMGKFVFAKSEVSLKAAENIYNTNAPGGITYDVPYANIKYDSLRQEDNNLNVVSFEVEDESHKNYNLYFQKAAQARYFVINKTLPDGYIITWARIYSHYNNVYIFFEDMINGDLGFKLFTNHEDTADKDKIETTAYLFMRSEIENSFKLIKAKGLLMRNAMYKVDYSLEFESEHERGLFRSLFPNTVRDDDRTRDYFYIIPYQ